MPDSTGPTEPTEIAVTIVGRDRPGIIARTAGLLSGLGMNLEDSSMTRLRGHFTMTLICVGDTPVAEVSNALEPLADDALNVTVRAVPADLRPDAAGAGAAAWLVSVHGADRLGIVAEIASVIAKQGGNITDLTTRLSGALYVLTAEVDLPADADSVEFTAALRQAAEVLGVEITCEPLADDEL